MPFGKNMEAGLGMASSLAACSSDEYPEIRLEHVRAVLQAYCKDGQFVTNTQLYSFMALDAEVEQSRLRTCVNRLVAAGEVQRVGRGSYIYNFGQVSRQDGMIKKIWRFVRSQKAGWTTDHCALLTHVARRHVRRYVYWLLENSYIEQFGITDETQKTYAATALALSQPDAPYQPTIVSDAFLEEKVAASVINRALLCKNPYLPGTAQEIVEACQLLLARFETNVT